MDKSRQFPALANLVIEIVPDSFAAKAGITPGCIMLPSGRFFQTFGPGVGSAGENAPPRADENELIWVTPDYEKKMATSPPGPAGVIYIFYRNVIHWYLNHGQRQAKWDGHVLSALIAQASDSGLAESCWAAARANGYEPDKLMHWSMAFILADNGNFQGSNECINAFGTLNAPKSDTDFPLKETDWVLLGLRCGNMTCIKQALECFPQGSLNFTPESAANLVALSAANPTGPNPPSMLADKMKHRSFLREAKNGPDDKAVPMMVKMHRKAASTRI